MLNYDLLTDEDFDKMAQEIQQISDSKTNDDLFETIGNALHANGFEVASLDSNEFLQPQMLSEDMKFSMTKTVNFFANKTPLDSKKARRKGKKFWKKFKANLRENLCNDSKIKELMEGEGRLKDYLKAGIPLILTAIGISALNPFALAIVAVVFALIAKVGFKTYCQVGKEKSIMKDKAFA